jgi:hypothetical protein
MKSKNPVILSIFNLLVSNSILNFTILDTVMKQVVKTSCYI